tara:strand:+ start:2501 stop:2683 length:183 start_codon:yes stop_codon:yes gene_type:complete
MMPGPVYGANSLRHAVVEEFGEDAFEVHSAKAGYSIGVLCMKDIKDESPKYAPRPVSLKP